MLRQITSLALLVTLCGLIGCSSPSESVQPITGPDAIAPGQFQFSVDGTTINSANYLAATGLISRLPLGSTFLKIEFSIYDLSGSGAYTSLEMEVNQFVPHAAEYDLAGRVGDASLYYDTASFESVDGSLSITAVDTIANVITGSFHFSAKSYDGRTIEVTSGIFKAIPIALGAYGQGHISATANHQQFSTEYEGIESVTAYRKLGMMMILAQSVEGTSQRLLQFMLPSQKEGTMTIGASSLGVTANYSEYTGSADDVSVDADQGQLVLTKFDPTTHRMSGTFSFSGRDASTNQLVQITNGVIDNVQWFDQ